MSSLGRNISANLLSNVWSTALSLLLTPLYVRYLGVEAYALIGFNLSWVAILAILDAGISATASREIAWLSAHPERRHEIPPLIRSLEVVYWGTLLTVGSLILAAAWRFGASWFHTTQLAPAVVRDALMLMAVAIVAQVPSGLYVGGLMGLQRQVECSGLLAIFGTIRGFGALLVVWLVAPDIRAFFVWQIASAVLQTGTLRLRLWRRIHTDGRAARFSLAHLHGVKDFAGAMLAITALSSAISQADKMILTRAVPLETYGLYMVAWAAASGLSRVTTPLMQAFAPRFTELAARGDLDGLKAQVRTASRVMNVLILPAAAVIALLSRAVLTAWIGTPSVVSGAAPLLAVLVAGTALGACSFPAVSVLYSQHRLAPVLRLNFVALCALIPLLTVAIWKFGAVGASYCWGLYGLIQYIAYQSLWLRSTGDRLTTTILRDFAPPLAASLVVAAGARWAVDRVHGVPLLILVIGVGLLAAWAAALLVSRDLLVMVVHRLKWNTRASR